MCKHVYEQNGLACSPLDTGFLFGLVFELIKVCFHSTPLMNLKLTMTEQLHNKCDTLLTFTYIMFKGLSAKMSHLYSVSVIVYITCLSLCLLLFVSYGFHLNQNNGVNMCTGFWTSMMLRTHTERSQFPGSANSSQHLFRTIF